MKAINTKALITNLAHNLGYEIIPSWRAPAKPQADLLSALFERNNINYVLDVGANRGQYADFLRMEVGFKGRIISFEPIAENIRHLKHRSHNDPLWSICGFALGRESGIADLNVMELDVFSSFLTPTHDHIDKFKEKNNVKQVEQVAVKRLIDILTELNIDVAKSPTFLKLDTQGFDLEVLAGASTAINHIKGIQSEVSVLPIYQGMPDMLESLAIMKGLGFSLAGMFPVTVLDNLSAIEFDAILVRIGATLDRNTSPSAE